MAVSITRSTGMPLVERVIDTAMSDQRYDDQNEPEYASPGRVLVWPGEFVLGHRRQDPRHPRKPDASPTTCTPSWSRNGSFLVFRRILQDVAAFRAFSDAQSKALGIKQDDFEALLVGRAKDAAPLVNPVSPPVDDNHFRYAD